DHTEPSVWSESGAPIQGTNYAATVRARAELSHNQVRNDSATRDLGAITRAGIRMVGFADGTSNTIMIGEVFRGRDFASCNGSGSEVPGTCTTAPLNRQRCRDWMESTAWCQANAGVVVDTSIPVTSGNPKQYVLRFRINAAKNPSDPASRVHQDQVSWADRTAGGNSGGRPMSSTHPGGVQACMG